MRATKLNLSILLVLTMSISACGLYGSAQTKQEAHERQKQEGQQESQKTRDRESQKKEWVDYEPAIVELKGKLIIKTFYGPPNYGENPDTDTKEDLPILLLSKPVNVRGKTDPDAWYERDSVKNIREMELVLRMPHQDMIGKTVIVKGTLFGAHTGHHHTDVLMDVQSIRLALSH